MPHVTLTTATQLPEHSVNHHLHNYTLSPSGRTSRQRQQTPGARQEGSGEAQLSPHPVCPENPSRVRAPGDWQKAGPHLSERLHLRQVRSRSERALSAHREHSPAPAPLPRLHRHVPRPGRRGTPEPAGAPLDGEPPGQPPATHPRSEEAP